MAKKYEEMGNEMTKALGMENVKVVLYWKAFDECRWLSCEVLYGSYKVYGF